MTWWCSAQGIPWDWGWRAYPGVWLFVIAIAAAYLTLGRGRTARSGTAARFWTGLAILWVALDWPLGALGAGYLASAHMVQFVLIALAAPPLLLTGVPEAGYEAIAQRPGAARALGLLTRPLVAILVFNLVIVVTHWPAVVDVLMATQPGSFALDLAWLSAGVIFWWPVIAPVPARPIPYVAKVGYVLLATVSMTLPYIFLTFAELPFYATYELAPPVGGLSTREDQRVAGLIMRVGGGAILWIAAGILFFRWYRSENEDMPAGWG